MDLAALRCNSNSIDFDSFNFSVKFVAYDYGMQMVAVDSADLWFAYNLIAPGDSVMAVTVRYSFSQFSLPSIL